MDGETIRLARAARDRDWPALGLLLDRLEETGDRRRDGLWMRLGTLSAAMEKAGEGYGPAYEAKEWSRVNEARKSWHAAMEAFSGWFAAAFWEELEEGGRQGLFQRMERGLQ